MNAGLLWKAFAVALGGTVLYVAVTATENLSVAGAVVLLFKALTVVGLVGFAWGRAILWQRLWKSVLVAQLLVAVVFLVQIVSGLVRFSDAALFVSLLQATLFPCSFSLHAHWPLLVCMVTHSLGKEGERLGGSERRGSRKMHR